jgi:hypothetical protein
MRIEGGDDQRGAALFGNRARTTDHGLVAQVKTVEISERDNAPAQMRWHDAVA